MVLVTAPSGSLVRGSIGLRWCHGTARCERFSTDSLSRACSIPVGRAVAASTERLVSIWVSTPRAAPLVHLFIGVSVVVCPLVGLLAALGTRILVGLPS